MGGRRIVPPAWKSQKLPTWGKEKLHVNEIWLEELKALGEGIGLAREGLNLYVVDRGDRPIFQRE